VKTKRVNCFLKHSVLTPAKQTTGDYVFFSKTGNIIYKNTVSNLFNVV